MQLSSLQSQHAAYTPRPFNYMFFTPLYGARNTGCPQISQKNVSKLEKKETHFF
jgi:hypothetical protein